MNVQLIGYVRCSTKEQNPERQIIALQKFGVPKEAIVVEMMSGKNFERPVYQKMVSKLKPGHALVIDSLDRLGRDRNAVIDEWRHITKVRGADIVVLDMLPLLDTRKKEQDITASFVADLVLQVLCYVCEKERHLNRERQAAGIAVAKAKGVKFGRTPIKIPKIFNDIYNQWSEGTLTATEAAKRLKISRPTFMTWVEKSLV